MLKRSGLTLYRRYCYSAEWDTGPKWSLQVYHSLCQIYVQLVPHKSQVMCITCTSQCMAEVVITAAEQCALFTILLALAVLLLMAPHLISFVLLFTIFHNRRYACFCMVQEWLSQKVHGSGVQVPAGPQLGHAPSSSPQGRHLPPECK